MQWKKIVVPLFLFTWAFFLPAAARAQTAEPPPYQADQYFRARVVDILEEGVRKSGGADFPYQTLNLEILDGAEKGRFVLVEHGAGVQLLPEQTVREGEKVVLIKSFAFEKPVYLIQDPYRVPALLGLLGVFFFLVLLLGRWRGLGSMAGLAFTVAVLLWYVAPKILSGADPIVVSLIGSCVIVLSSIFLAHGFSRRTVVAAASILFALGLAVVFAVFAVQISRLLGVGSEEAFYAGDIIGKTVNFKGLLLAGMIIGTLGVLDDIVTAQAATIDEIAKANPALTFRDLYRRGASVGREHIASLVNTLVLAYAGSSLPLFLLFTADKTRPAWVIANSPFVAEEIVRTLVGSTALLFAVPITTALAAAVLRKKSSPSTGSGNR